MLEVFIVIVAVIIAAAVAIAVALAIHRVRTHAQTVRRRDAATWEAITAIGTNGTIVTVQLIYRGSDGPTYFERETLMTLSNNQQDYEADLIRWENEASKMAREHNTRHYRSVNARIL